MSTKEQTQKLKIRMTLQRALQQRTFPAAGPNDKDLLARAACFSCVMMVSSHHQDQARQAGRPKTRVGNESGEIKKENLHCPAGRQPSNIRANARVFACGSWEELPRKARRNLPP